jgi:hypothetical protein
MYDYDRRAMEHSSPAAKKKYLHDHPQADPKNHTVKKEQRGGGAGGSEGAQQTADRLVKEYGVKPGLEKKVQKLKDVATELDKLEKDYSKLNPDDRYTKQRKIEEAYDEYAKLLGDCTGVKPKKPWYYGN